MNQVEQIFRSHVGDKCWPRGDELYMLCVNPEHEDRKPSMSVNVDTLLYHCMGCGIGGHADELLAKLAGIRITEARAILKGSGVRTRSRSDSVIPERKFSGAFVPLQTGRLINYLRGRAITDIRLLDLREGAITDAVWRNRIVWAYRNRNGRLIQVEGRNTDGNYSRPVYFKLKDSRNVGGFAGTESLDACRKPVLVVEGVFDLLSARSVGYTRSLAQGGSAFGKERALALKTWTDHPVVLYDAPNLEGKSIRERTRTVNQRNDVHRKTRAALSAYFKSYDVLVLSRGDPNELLVTGELASELKGLGLKKSNFI